MGVVVDDPRSPLGWPRRRPSLRRRVAELERLNRELVAGFEARLHMAEIEIAALRAWRAPSVRRFDHEPAVGRLLASEIEASERRTGSPT